MQRTECLRSLRELAAALAERPARGDLTGEVCHWADGYHLNIRLYEKMLWSVFDVLDEGKLTEVVIHYLSFKLVMIRFMYSPLFNQPDKYFLHDSLYSRKWKRFLNYLGQPGVYWELQKPSMIHAIHGYCFVRYKFMPVILEGFIDLLPIHA